MIAILHPDGHISDRWDISDDSPTVAGVKEFAASQGAEVISMPDWPEIPKGLQPHQVRYRMVDGKVVAEEVKP